MLLKHSNDVFFFFFFHKKIKRKELKSMFILVPLKLLTLAILDIP